MSALTRVYLTLSAADLGDLAENGEVPHDGLRAFAVTPALRQQHPNDDVEGWEYLATQDAAAAAEAGARIVVAAADVADSTISPADGSAVTLTAAVPRRRVASLHVGDPGASAADGADLELSWYDITELDDVRRLLDE